MTSSAGSQTTSWPTPQLALSVIGSLDEWPTSLLLFVFRMDLNYTVRSTWFNQASYSYINETALQIVVGSRVYQSCLRLIFGWRAHKSFIKLFLPLRSGWFKFQAFLLSVFCPVTQLSLTLSNFYRIFFARSLQSMFKVSLFLVHPRPHQFRRQFLKCHSCSP